ncbi:hypothetical protein GQ457_04G028240 [Hibiscus cannabinus]
MVYERLQCQTDCAKALKLITSSSAHTSPLHLVCNISRLATKPWMLEFRLIRREANTPVDAIAKASCDHFGYVRIINDPPTSVLDILYIDLYDPPTPRITT